MDQLYLSLWIKPDSLDHVLITFIARWCILKLQTITLLFHNPCKGMLWGGWAMLPKDYYSKSGCEIADNCFYFYLFSQWRPKVFRPVQWPYSNYHTQPDPQSCHYWWRVRGRSLVLTPCFFAGLPGMHKCGWISCTCASSSSQWEYMNTPPSSLTGHWLLYLSSL